jgi:hypothetical protein
LIITFFKQYNQHTAREKLKAIQKIQDYIKSGKTNPKDKELIESGFDVSMKSQIFRNIKLEKDFWGEWALKIIDPLDIYMQLFKNNFMVIIAGSAEDKKEKYVQDLIKKVIDSMGSHYYLEAH